MLFNLSSELGYSIIIYCGGDRTFGKKARSHFLNKERSHFQKSKSDQL